MAETGEEEEREEEEGCGRVTQGLCRRIPAFHASLLIFAKRATGTKAAGGLGQSRAHPPRAAPKMKSGMDPCLGYAPCLEKVYLCVNKCGEPLGWIVAPSCPPCGSTGPLNQAGGSGVK